MSSTRLFQNGLDRQIALIRIGKMAVEMIQSEDALNNLAREMEDDNQIVDPTGDGLEYLEEQHQDRLSKLYGEVREFIRKNHANGGAPGHTGEAKE